MAEQRPTVLVVVADPTVRQLVGWILDEMELSHILVSTWRAGVAEMTSRPALAICDIDDLQGTQMGMLALVSRGWDAPVPLIVLNGRPDVDEIAGAIGAVEGLRKPINIGQLMAAVREVVEQ